MVKVKTLENTVKSLIILLAFLSIFASSASFAFDWGSLFGGKEEREPPSRSTQSQELSNEELLNAEISIIDLEILTLKAELAQERGDISALRNHLQALKKYRYIPPNFQQRINELQRYLDQSKEPSGFGSLFGLSPEFTFPMNDSRAVVAVVLPLSGNYAKASKTILAELRHSLSIQGFRGRIVEFDTLAYSNVFRLWDQVNAYSPKFIFGPMQKIMIEEWHQLDTQIPTLYFNDLAQSLFSYEKALSPSSGGQVRKVANALTQGGFERALILSDGSVKGTELAEALQQRWLAESPASLIDIQVVNKSVSEAMSQAVGVDASKQRASILRRVVRRSIESEAEPRKDLQVVVSLLSPAQAVQISPALKYYGLAEVQHYWFPSGKLRVADLEHFQNSWQATTAFLPSYLLDASQETESYGQNQTGIFHALGSVAAEIVNQAEFLSKRDWLISTSYGQVEANRNGQLYLLPTAYWLDKGKAVALDMPAE